MEHATKTPCNGTVDTHIISSFYTENSNNDQLGRPLLI